MALKKDIFNKYIQTRESNDLNDALKRKKRYTHNKVFELSTDDQSNSTNNNKQLVKDDSNASQKPVKDLSNDSQTLVKDDSNASQEPVKDLSNDSQTLVKDDSNASQEPVKDLSNASQEPVKDLSNDSQTLVKDDSNASQEPVKDLSNDSQTLVKDDSNASQEPVKDLSNDSQTLVKDDSNASQDSVDIHLENLTGLQEQIVNYMLNNFENKNLRVTIKMTTAMFISALESNKSMVEQGIYRLKKKGYIDLYKRKNGRGGWCQYKLHKNLIIFKNASQTNKNISPIYNNTITTNKNNNTNDQKTDSTEKDNLIAQMQQQISELQKQQSQLNQPQSVEVKKDQGDSVEDVTVTELNEDDWLDLDYSSLTEFGFKKSHVNQIKKFNAKLDADSQLTADSVQDSIEHYAWALRNKLSEMENYAPSTNRLRGLLGVLKRGGEWVEPNYKSPEDLAYEASLKAKKERLEKIKAQKDELFMLEFEMWRDGLSDEQLAEVEEKGKLKAAMPPSAFKNKGDNTYYVNALKSYYKKNEYKG